MTTFDLNIEQVTARAIKIKPMRVVLWILAAPFILVGLVLRLLWLAPAFFIAATMDGWGAADKMVKQMQLQARESASRGG